MLRRTEESDILTLLQVSKMLSRYTFWGIVAIFGFGNERLAIYTYVLVQNQNGNMALFGKLGQGTHW